MTAQPEPQPTIVVSCGKVSDITKEDLNQAADELAKLPPDSVVVSIILTDWIRMRDENRACSQQK